MISGLSVSAQEPRALRSSGEVLLGLTSADGGEWPGASDSDTCTVNSQSWNMDIGWVVLGFRLAFWFRVGGRSCSNFLASTANHTSSYHDYVSVGAHDYKALCRFSDFYFRSQWTWAFWVKFQAWVGDYLVSFRAHQAKTIAISTLSMLLNASYLDPTTT